MNKSLLQTAAVALILLILPTSVSMRAEAVVTIDPSIRYGTWQGWGTSLGNIAGVVGKSGWRLSRAVPQRLYDERVRSRSGTGTEYRALQYRRRGEPALSGPEQRVSFVSGRRPRLRTVARRLGLERGCEPALGLEIGHPAWREPARSLLQLAAVVADRQRECRRRPQCLGQPAARRRHRLCGLSDPGGSVFSRKLGVTFRDIEPLNEPAASWWYFGGNGNKQEGCHMDPVHQNALVKAVIASLARRGMAYAPTTASDETAVSAADSTF